MVAPNLCEYCGDPFQRRKSNPNFCSPECRDLSSVTDAEILRTIDEVLGRPSRGQRSPKAQIVTDKDTGETYKLCVDCGGRMEIEYNSRGQMTTRSVCDVCSREKHNMTRRVPPPEVPRCKECTAVVGLEWGSSVTYLNDNGHCPACAEWLAKYTKVAV